MRFVDLPIGAAFTFDRGSPWLKRPMVKIADNAYRHYDGRELIPHDKTAPTTDAYRQVICETCDQSMWFPNDRRTITIEHIKGKKRTLLPFDMHIIHREEATCRTPR